jgi:hypothetical protein
MKKLSNRKLSLRRDTLQIEPAELPAAVGGSKVNNTVYYPPKPKQLTDSVIVYA